MKKTVLTFLICYTLAGCTEKTAIHIERPIDVWAFRSVLGKNPRMLTLALNSDCYVAYDLAHGNLLKVWKGGVSMEGAPYTSKKNVQPSSWGTSYLTDSIGQQKWEVLANGQNVLSKIINKGYLFKDGQIYLNFSLILSSSDTINLQERPEFIREGNGKPGLERWFKTENVPVDHAVSLTSGKSSFDLTPNSVSLKTDYFETLPEQFPPKPQNAYDHQGKYLMEKSDCFTCHEVAQQDVGPSFHQIAARYKDTQETSTDLLNKIKIGGSGSWGETSMNAHPQLKENEIKTMLAYIYSLNPEEIDTASKIDEIDAGSVENKFTQPGYGAPLKSIHPSYDLTTLHTEDFKPKVGGLTFLPDGRLLLTTWDTEGAVYLLDDLDTGDPNKITKKRIASGLAEPLGIEVVDRSIYVLQKHELTQLIDLNGDDIIDEYKAICNSWQVTADFHEFAFGLVFKKGHFYISLSMAMRLLSTEQQQFDRGRVLKIALDGSYEWINYGLRTPNGIGLGVDEELFVTDNQGQWLPANKLIHVKKGDYHGMEWGLLDSISEKPKMTPPTIWLPQDEISNSPSEPVAIPNGPYKGQMLHGDVSNGGIKRDFIEKINGNYQGAVFRFSQGFEAGVNRLSWGPNGSLYIGEVGMLGGWAWKEKKYGLQRMTYNGKPTFEMLAVRAKPKGFEIEFTQPLEKGKKIMESDFFLQQWWYLPTMEYGGPKIDLMRLRASKIKLSEDRTKMYLEIPDLKKENVVYFRIPDGLRSVTGASLWSSEAWYTLNNIPQY